MLSVKDHCMALPTENRNEDTIAAVATAMSEAGIGIIRISGPDAIRIGSALFRSSKMKNVLSGYSANTIHFGYIVDLTGGKEQIVDEVMISVMKHPHSYTTEDTVEINAHGGTYVLQRILELVLSKGARLAEPGEFTKRAFLGGRIDLAKAEAVMDLISSQSEFARRTAVDQLEGSVSERIKEFRAQILYEIAFIESALDDPENYSTEGYPEILDQKLQLIIAEMEKLLSDSENSRILKDGIRTVIIGKPNAGKSSLLNYLTGTERAIVTDIAGTTRDTLEESVRLNGVLLNITDTAGIRDTSDTVERIGVDRAKHAAENSDLLLLLIDTSDHLSDEDCDSIRLFCGQISCGKKGIILLNKSDLEKRADESQVRELVRRSLPESDGSRTPEIPVITISLHNGNGLSEMTDTIMELFHTGEIAEKNEVHLTSLRHRQAVIAAADSLRMVRKSIAARMSEDFYSIDLMNAYSSLGTVIGEQVDDDLVEEIFSRFCMGK